MANFYVQHGLYPAYTATPSAIAPAAGAAQEGDGLAIGLSTSAYATIDCTSLTAAAGNTISVCGATLTCVASGATTNQFNAGSGATLATNLAAAINRTTNTSKVNAAATSWTAPFVQNALYASVSGAVLTVQTRAGSAIYNANALWQITSATITGYGSAVQFSGGASGAWGYITNNSTTATTIWPSGVAAWTYGIGKNADNTAPLAGPLTTVNDYVFIRSGTTASSNVVLTSLANNVTNLTFAYATNYVVDDGTIWTADAAVTITGNSTNNSPTITGIASTASLVVGQTFTGPGVPLDTYINSKTANTVTLSNNLTATASGVSFTSYPSVILQNTNIIGYGLSVLFAANINGKAYFGAKAVGRFVLRAYHPTGGCDVIISGSNNTSSCFENIYLLDANSSGGSAKVTPSASSAGDLTIIGGSFAVTRNDFYSIFSTTAAYSSIQLIVDGMTFQWPAFTGSSAGVFSLAGLTGNLGCKYIFRNCRNLSTSRTIYVFTSRPTPFGNGHIVIAENNSGFSVNVDLGLVGLATTATGPLDSSYIVQQNVGSTRQSRFESNYFTRDWQPGASFPTLTATLPDNTLWAYRFLWAGPSLAGATRSFAGVEILKLAKTAVTAGLQNVVVECYVPAAIAASITNYHLMMAVTYTSAADSIQKTEYTTGLNASFFNAASASALPSSAASWTANGYANYVPVKLQVALSNAILTNTEVMCAIRLVAPAPSANQTIFIHPDIGVS